VTWLVVILGLALLVFPHELGHFSVARLAGMKPRAFYIGFPPAVVCPFCVRTLLSVFKTQNDRNLEHCANLV